MTRVIRQITTVIAGLGLMMTGFAISSSLAAPMKKTALLPTAAPTGVRVAGNTRTSDAAAPISADEAITIKLYKAANKAVVNITSISPQQDMYFRVMPHEGTGSGTIISPDGYILTNNHVVERAQQVQVNLYNGVSVPATIVGTDPSNDLAVLKIDPPAGMKLSTLPFGDSNCLEVGRRVFAIGNPFGLDRTLTEGIVSSIGRTLKTENGRMIKGIIQTDAAINPGNSGGPLLDAAGNMIGINTAIMSRTGQSSGIGFAIPANIARRIIPELIAHHQVIRPELGVLMVQPTDRGLRVVSLDPSGPAAQAGITGAKERILHNGPFTIRAVDNSVGDIIMAADAVKIRSVDDLLTYIEEKKPGQVVTLTLLRNGQTVKVPVKLSTSSPT
jgi:S1-C subfamily serine protease